MVDIFLLVVTIVVFLLLFVGSFYLLVNYQHPDDKNEAYFPKTVVVLGFVLAGATVLGLPLDVANNEGYAGTCRNDTGFYGASRVPKLSHESNESYLLCLLDYHTCRD
jgi:LMBR1 domain-containing protein 1